MTLRRLRQIVVLLLLGALVNVAVAWGLAVLLDVKAGLVDGPDSRLQYASKFSWQRTGAYRTYSISLTTADFPFEAKWGASWNPLSPDSPDDDVKKKWRTLPSVTDIIDARGWPFLSAMSWTQLRDGTERQLAGIVITRGPSLHHQMLPTRPICPGFAINTIFYAAILWALCAMPFALRRKRRLRRGLCPACAYPVGASPVCTECGTAVRPPI